MIENKAEKRGDQSERNLAEQFFHDVFLPRVIKGRTFEKEEFESLLNEFQKKHQDEEDKIDATRLYLVVSIYRDQMETEAKGVPEEGILANTAAALELSFAKRAQALLGKFLYGQESSPELMNF